MRTFQADANWCDGNPHCRGNLGIPRTKMPQVKKQFTDSFLAYLGDAGVSVRQMSIPAKDLHPTQKNIIPDLVAKVIEEGWHKANDRPVYATADNYILDGHHRWAAWIDDDPTYRMSVLQIDRSVREVLDLVRAFPDIQYSSRRAMLKSVRRLMSSDKLFRQDFEAVQKLVRG